MLKILILAALPYEYAYLRRITPRWRTLRKNPFKTFSFSLPDKEILITEMGMGSECASKAFRYALTEFGPDIVISAGFSGGIHPGLSVGDVCVLRSVAKYKSDGGITGKLFRMEFSPEIEKFCSEETIREAVAIAVSTPPQKQVLGRLADGETALVDMETAAVAEVASGKQIPLLCLRSVSDGLEDELGFDLNDIAGGGGKVRIAKVLRLIMLNPAVIAAFYRSWKRSAVAGRTLGIVLRDFLLLPAAVISRQHSPVSLSDS